MSEYDTTALLSDTKERGSLPDNDLRFTDALLLASLTRELREGIAPMLAAARVEHLVYAYDVTVVPSQAAYRMPSRAAGGTLRDVVFTDTAGNPWPLILLSADQIRQIGPLSQQGTPTSYYLRNYDVVLVPVPNVAGTLSLPYYARPNRLVIESAVPVLSVSNVGTAWEIQSDQNPSGLSTGTYALDLVRGTPGFETLATTFTVTEPSPDDWRYAFTLPVGEVATTADYLCLPGTAPVPQCPVELFGLLAVRGARRALKAVGDDRWQALEADVAELEDKARDWLMSRVSGDTEQAGGQVGSSGLVVSFGFGGVGGYF